jgi:hypothetical protein
MGQHRGRPSLTSWDRPYSICSRGGTSLLGDATLLQLLKMRNGRSLLQLGTLPVATLCARTRRRGGRCKVPALAGAGLCKVPPPERAGRSLLGEDPVVSRGSRAKILIGFVWQMLQ